MKRKAKNKSTKPGTTNHSQPTVFEIMMNLQCDLRAEAGLTPLPHWTKTRETPAWTKNICRKLSNTILKSVLKLRPKRKVNWRHYGRCIGIAERYKTFLVKDVPQILKKEGLNKISKKQWQRIQPLLGEKEARQYYLKVLERPKNNQTPLPELVELAHGKQIAYLEKIKEIAFFHLASQSAKTTHVFLKSMSEGYTAFLNEDGQFSGDDRRADIHLELIAWQYDIEKMRRSLPQKNNKHLVTELKKLPEFKNKTPDWFNDVFKSIKLSIGRRGRPVEFSRA